MMTSIWNDFGFSDNPYNPRPIEANEEGEQLLVGRGTELRNIKARLSSSGTHPTLEGQNGVGKTSLATIALYQMFKSFRDGASQQAIIPASDPLQLTPSDHAVAFKKRVLFRVAQTMIEHHDLLRSRGYNIPDVSAIETWLNSPTASGWSGGFNLAGAAGVNAGASTNFNTGQGFAEDGFVSTVQQWLRDCFPTQASGAIVFVIDNLEILETSRAARQMLESLRDELLGLRGLRWVICGARGIMRSAASSPRLQGVLADPLEVAPLPDTVIPELIRSRIEVFSIDCDPLVPVDEHSFEHLYTVGNKNLRNAFKFSEDFSIWVSERGYDQISAQDLRDLLEIWMAEIADRYEEATTGITPTGWRVFDQLCSTGGFTSPSQYSEYGFESPQALRPYLKNLEDANLIESSVDDSDNRRKSISVSSSGWVVAYKRAGYQSQPAS